jgi:hypothetical protein
MATLVIWLRNGSSVRVWTPSVTRRNTANAVSIFLQRENRNDDDIIKVTADGREIGYDLADLL